MKKPLIYIAQERLKVNKDSLNTAFVAVPPKDQLTPAEKSSGKATTTGTKVSAVSSPALKDKTDNSLVKSSATTKELIKKVAPPQTLQQDRKLMQELFKATPSNLPPTTKVKTSGPVTPSVPSLTSKRRPVRL